MPPKSETSEVSEAVDYSKVDGFHVFNGDTFLGTYPTEEDAQAFIDQHLKPQDVKGKIVEGKAGE